MKLKGVNPLEQHVEKIVLGVFALIFLAVAALQFLREPNQVEVSGKRVPPQMIFDDLEKQARALESQLQAADPPKPQPQRLEFSDRLAALTSESQLPRTTLAYTGAVPRFQRGEISALGTGGLQLAERPIIAPTQPIAAAQLVTLSPTEIASTPGLAELVGLTQPVDVAAVTVEATLDVARVTAALDADPDGAGPLVAVPSSWWRGRLEIVGVSMERQRLISPGPGGDAQSGTWGEDTLIAELPGSPDLATSLNETITARPQLDAMLQDAQQLAEEIRQPTFLTIIAGAPWSPPSVSAGSAGAALSREADLLLRQRTSLLDDRPRLLVLAGLNEETPWTPLWELPQAKRDELLAPPPRPDRPAPPEPDPDRRDPRVRNDPQGPAGTPPPGGRPPPRANEQTAAARVRLDRADRRLAKIESDLLALGWKPPQQQAEGKPEFDEDLQLLRNQSVRFWRHDVTAQPGQIYRYRVAAIVSNPFFGRSGLLAPTSQQLAVSPTMVGEHSAWTAPLVVPSRQYVFVTGAQLSSEGAIARTQATVEVFEFYYGYYRRGSATLQPGDRLSVSFKLPGNLLDFDITKAASGDPQSPAQPGGRDARDPGGGEGAVVVSPTPAPGGRDPVSSSAGKALPTQRSSELSYILLDVIESISQGGKEVVLVGPDGRIERRHPETDRLTGPSSMLAKSAKEGESQGEPKADAPRRDLEALKRRLEEQRNRANDPSDPGGGGGDGGAGGG